MDDRSNIRIIPIIVIVIIIIIIIIIVIITTTTIILKSFVCRALVLSLFNSAYQL